MLSLKRFFKLFVTKFSYTLTFSSQTDLKIQIIFIFEMGICQAKELVFNKSMSKLNVLNLI